MTIYEAYINTGPRSMSGTACPKCHGEGLVAREGVEADNTLHPILSKHKTVCLNCGGSGKLSNEDEAIRKRNAARMEQG